MFEITVTETIEYRFTVDPANFPDGYNFEDDPDLLLDDHAADQASEGAGFVGVTEREIQLH